MKAEDIVKIIIILVLMLLAVGCYKETTDVIKYDVQGSGNVSIIYLDENGVGQTIQTELPWTTEIYISEQYYYKIVITDINSKNIQLIIYINNEIEDTAKYFYDNKIIRANYINCNECTGPVNVGI
jgi:hypothetical protein